MDFRINFKGFLRLRHAEDLTRGAKGRLCFCWQAWYETEVPHFMNFAHRQELVPTGLHEPDVRKDNAFFRSGLRIDVNFNCLGVLRHVLASPKNVFFFNRDACGMFRAFLGSS